MRATSAKSEFLLLSRRIMTSTLIGCALENRKPEILSEHLFSNLNAQPGENAMRLLGAVISFSWFLTFSCASSSCAPDCGEETGKRGFLFRLFPWRSVWILLVVLLFNVCMPVSSSKPSWGTQLSSQFLQGRWRRILKETLSRGTRKALRSRPGARRFRAFKT